MEIQKASATGKANTVTAGKVAFLLPVYAHTTAPIIPEAMNDTMQGIGFRAGIIKQRVVSIE